MALVDASGPLLGVILDPQRDDLYAATVAVRPRSTGEPVHASDKEHAERLRGQPGGDRARRPGPRATDHALDPHPSAHGLRGAGAGVRGQRAVRRLRPERRPVAVGRGGRRPDRGARRGHRQRPARRPVVGPAAARAATISIVAARPPQHAALLELLAAVGTQVRPAGPEPSGRRCAGRWRTWPACARWRPRPADPRPR